MTGVGPLRRLRPHLSLAIEGEADVARTTGVRRATSSHAKAAGAILRTLSASRN